ncbi:hypothetical protein ACHWQZ_G009791 [Mnemiopsis leidyi]
MAPSTRQPILFPVLEDIEFCSCKADLVTQHDGEVYVCNPDNSHCYIFYHRDLEPNKPIQAQELMLSQIPSFTISRIAVSPKGQKLLLWGDHGIAVVDIPRRRRANGITTCRSTLIGARFFQGHTKIAAIDVKWHPGYTEDSHLVALTSDNILRVYSTEEPACAVSSYPLFNTDSIIPYLHCLNVSTGPSLLSAQAGNMVSFTFGPFVEEEEAVTVFVLEENSDVFSLALPLDNRGSGGELKGPLKVLPPDNENYELDACSILCLQSNPPVLVIATLSGILQHLSLLQDPEVEEEESLYLLETVEIELPGLTEEGESACTQSSDEEVSAVSLLPDPTSRDRYFVRHNTGIHSVFLPAVQRLEHFVKAEDGELNLECECVAEHMLCVQPVGAGDPTCLFGSTVVLDPMLGANLLVLISNAEFISLPIRSVHREEIPLLSGGEKTSHCASPMKQVHSQLFSQKLQGILARNVSNPLLRCGNSSGMSQKALLELLMKSTQVFREEYIAKQSKARGELLHHMTLLQEQQTQHKSELTELQHTVAELAGEGEKLSDRSSRISKRQQLLRQRVSTVMREVQQLLPDLSTAEIAFKDEMNSMSRSLKSLQQDAEQLHQKLKFQTKTAKNLPTLSAEQQDRVRAILKENDNQINSLVSKIKTANAQYL